MSERGTPWFVLVLIALSFPILFYGLGSYSLVNGDEGFYHAISRRMLETGNWLRLEFTGEHRIYETFLNAPLQYWVRANVIRMLGDSYFSMRVVSALAALGCVLSTFGLGRLVAGPRAGFFSGLALLTTFQFVYLHSARTGEIDPLVCLAMTLSAFFFLWAIEKRRSFLPHFICIIAIANLKAPLFILPMAAGVAYLILFRAERREWRSYLLASLILPLGFIWHIAQSLQLEGHEVRGAFSAMFGVTSQDGGGLLKTWKSNVIFYFRVVVIGTYPFVLIYPLAILSAFYRVGDRLSRPAILVLLYAVVVFAFFGSLGAHFSWYVLPAYPFLSVLLGLAINRMGAGIHDAWLILLPAVLTAGVLLIQVPELNPFVSRAYTFVSPQLSATDLKSIGLGVILPSFAVAGALLLAAYWRRNWLPQIATSLVVVIFFGISLVRVISPLEWVDTQSKLQKFHDEIQLRRLTGAPLDLPQVIPGYGVFKVRFFFGDDFEIVRVPTDAGERYVLLREGRTVRRPKLFSELPPGLR